MRVLVTRPLDDGLRWVQALARQHIDALALPLIRILPTSDPAAVLAAWAQLGHHDAVMFVSAAAAGVVVTLNLLPTDLLNTISPYWFVPLVVTAVLGLIPLVFSRRA